MTGKGSVEKIVDASVRIASCVVVGFTIAVIGLILGCAVVIFGVRDVIAG